MLGGKQYFAQPQGLGEVSVHYSHVLPLQAAPLGPSILSAALKPRKQCQERQPKNPPHFPSPRILAALGLVAGEMPQVGWNKCCHPALGPKMLLSLCEHPVGTAKGAEPGSPGLDPWEGRRKCWHQVAPEQQPEGARCGSGPSICPGG